MRLRQRLAVLLSLVLCTGSTGTQGQTATRSDFRVTLLGSGIPVPQPDRFGPATLVEAGGQKLLFDAGRGATVRLFQLHVPLREVGPLFLTQFHSDHTTGIPDIWLSGVTAFEVDHGDLIKPAYGYRIDYDRRSVVISGDTRFNQNVIKYGTGATC